tara:strand:- start:3268 stop:5334 length:2067 start_codon:yes stop_codon:yes gene_type:complete
MESSVKRHRLILGHDLTNLQNLIITSSIILTDESQIDDYFNENTMSQENFSILNNSGINNQTLKNRVILSSNLNSTDQSDTSKYSCIPITQQNLTHNIGYIFLHNDITKPRIIFKKYTNFNGENKNQYLIENSSLSSINYNRSNFSITETQNMLIDVSGSLYINYYDNYRSSNYYLADLTDFMDNCQNILNINILDISKTSITTNYINNTQLNKFNNLYSLSTTTNQIDSSFQINSEISSLDISNILIYSIPDIEYNFDICYNFSNQDNKNVKIDTKLLVNHNKITDDKIHNNKLILKSAKNTHNDVSYIDINIIGRAIGDNNKLAQSAISSKFNRLYLSLGNGVTGLTQSSILSNIGINDNAKVIQNRYKIYIKRNIRFVQNANNYLVNSGYNYDYVNKLQYFKSVNLDRKNTTIPLVNSIDSSFNKNSINSYILSNNGQQPSSNIVSTSLLYEPEFRVSSAFDSSNNINYDFRFNYSLVFNTSEYVYLPYSINPIVILSQFSTSQGSDFTNINCIITYYDPTSPNTPDQFKYPNNNIDICTNTTIDTFSRAIQNLPELRTSNTNSVFIPDKNGSNISRKHILGLIGLNEVERLLSIEPYNEDFIIGRDSTNIDTCLTLEQLVERKINATRYKNHERVSRRQQFRNLVQSRARNRVVENCNLNINTIKKTTPFKMVYTGRGKYLPSK